MARNALAIHFAFNIAAPSNNFYSDRLPPQPLEQALSPISGAQHVHSLAKYRLTDKPSICAPPTKERNCQNHHSRQSRIPAGQEFGEEIHHAAQNKSYKAKNEQNPEYLVKLRADLRGIVEIETMRKQQDNSG